MYGGQVKIIINNWRRVLVCWASIHLLHSSIEPTNIHHLTAMNSPSHLSTSESAFGTPSLSKAQADGPIDIASTDMPKRRRLAGDVCAIFIHAGAGYHSLQNERVHLSACEE